MQLLNQLGINDTFFIQFAIFITAVFLLTKFVFSQYYSAYVGREASTIGNEKVAGELHKKAQELEGVYEVKAKEIHSKIKGVFDQYRENASKEYNSILFNSRQWANDLVEDAKKKITSSLQEASQELNKEVPRIGSEIVKKIVGRE